MTKRAPSSRTGRKPTAPIAPEVMDQALRELMNLPWIEVATLATVLRIGLAGAYREVAAGRFGAFKVGNLYRVPTAPIREALGLPTTPSALATEATSRAA